MTEPRLQSALRAGAFIALAAFIVMGPAYGHWLKGKSPFVPRWMMFNDIALNLFEVRFETADAQDRRAELDRFELLGYASRWNAPRKVLTLRSKADVSAVVRRVCSRLRGAPLYMHLRQASRSGWKAIASGEHDQCMAPRFPDRSRDNAGKRAKK